MQRSELALDAAWRVYDATMKRDERVGCYP
jgi:hypothetical protein